MAFFSTLCTVANGRMKLFERAAFDRALSQFGDGEEIELTLESLGAKHTRAQERFFHGPICSAAMKLGYTRQEAKDMFCLLHIPQEVRVPDGTIYRVPGHTKPLKRDRYSELIENSIQTLAEHGVVVEDADEWRRRIKDECRKKARRSSDLSDPATPSRIASSPTLLSSAVSG